MSVQVYSVPGQTVSRRKAFLEWKSIAMAKHPVNYLLHVGVMLTIAKVFIILFLFVRIGNILATFKINQYALFSIECPGIFSPWPNWRKEEELSWSVQEGESIMWDYPQEHLVVIRDEKVSPFVKFEIILLLICFY